MPNSESDNNPIMPPVSLREQPLEISLCLEVATSENSMKPIFWKCLLWAYAGLVFYPLMAPFAVLHWLIEWIAEPLSAFLNAPYHWMNRKLELSQGGRTCGNVSKPHMD
jgi:hypothetical protein